MKAYERTKRLIAENADKFEALSRELFEKESLDLEDIERICEVKLDKVKDKLVYAGKDPKRGTDELEDPSAYQEGEVKSVKDEVFSTPIKPLKKELHIKEENEAEEKTSKRTTAKKVPSPRKRKNTEE